MFITFAGHIVLLLLLFFSGKHRWYLCRVTASSAVVHHKRASQLDMAILQPIIYFPWDVFHPLYSFGCYIYCHINWKQFKTSVCIAMGVYKRVYPAHKVK